MTTESVLDYAIRYIKNGWSVIPLAAGTKVPPAGWPLVLYLTGERRMSADDATAYWSTHPDCGIAIITGRPSGLLVVDVDPRNGGDITSAQADCPSPLYVTTGSGGLHLYCVLPEERIACGKTARPGVDRKADGGYVVAPPSLHPATGKPYVWAALGTPLAEIPAWVLQAPESAAQSDHWIEQTLANPRSVLPGTQHETLTRLAWAMSGEMPEYMARGALLGFASQLPVSRDPWTSEHIDELLRSAYAKRAIQGPRSFTTTLPTPATPQERREAIRQRLKAKANRASEWVVNEAEQQWIVQHVLAPSCFTELVGEVKKGKTTFVCQLLYSVLNGEPFLGFAVERSPVVLYTEQAGSSLHRTLERSGIRHHPDLYFFRKTDMWGVAWEDVVDCLLWYCGEVGARVLVLDTLTRLADIAGDAENSAGSVGVLNPFYAAKGLGIACVFVRHGSKSLENRGDISRAARGSTAFTGDMDICALLRQPGMEDLRVLTIGGRLDEEFKLTLEYRDGVYVVVGEGAPKPGRQRLALDNRRKVEAAYAEGKRSEIEISAATGLSCGTVRKHLKQFLGSMGTEPPRQRLARDNRKKVEAAYAEGKRGEADISAATGLSRPTVRKYLKQCLGGTVTEEKD